VPLKSRVITTQFTTKVIFGGVHSLPRSDQEAAQRFGTLFTSLFNNTFYYTGDLGRCAQPATKRPRGGSALR
jgi:hypothetical protein